VGALNSAHIFGTHVPVEEPSKASKGDIRAFRTYAGYDTLHYLRAGGAEARSLQQAGRCNIHPHIERSGTGCTPAGEHLHLHLAAGAAWLAPMSRIARADAYPRVCARPLSRSSRAPNRLPHDENGRPAKLRDRYS
jgi:hypothetical protein